MVHLVIDAATITTLTGTAAAVHIQRTHLRHLPGLGNEAVTVSGTTCKRVGNVER